MTLAPAPTSLTRVACTSSEGCVGRDLLSRLVSPPARRPPTDDGLAGGLRAWLEDGIVGAGRLGQSGHSRGNEGCRLVVRGGTSARGAVRAGPSALSVQDLRACITRVIFRLNVVQDPPLQPFEDALRALSATEHGPELLHAVGRLRGRELAALRAFARARAVSIASQWRPVPAAWMPRTAERLRVPLDGGRVELRASADLVLGRPSGGEARTCLLHVLDERHSAAGAVRAGRARRERRAMALAETLRSGAPPWRVATYDPATGHLDCDDVGDTLLSAGVHDVLAALRQP